MAQIVKLRRSSVSGQKPTNDNLQLGELAVNTTDGKVFLAKSGSLGPTIEEIVTTNTINTGSINLIGGITVSGDVSGSNIKALSFIKSGGLPTQYLMADGGVSTLTNPITGTGTTNYLSKFSASDTLADSIIYDNGTNVGIGTTTPSEKLEVNGNIKATSFIKSGGTSTQALTANGGVFDLTTKADLENGKIPATQLPSYVDDVLEYANLASFPATGESGKIYIAIDTNLTYRWGGSSYVVMSSSLALGETSSTAYRGDRGKIAYDHSQVTGNPHGTTKADIGLGNIDNTSDLNKPISNATQTALNLKLSIESQSTTGTLISFTTDKVYGTLATPETGNITADVTDAKLGVTNIIIHNSSTAPTFGSAFKKLSGSGNYVAGVVNYIYCTFISNTEIIYSINQRS